MFAYRVGALKDPILPCGQSSEDFRLGRFLSRKTQRSLHTGQSVRRKGSALFNRDSDLIVPVQLIQRESYQTGLVSRFRVESPRTAQHFGDSFRSGEEARLEARQLVAHQQ